MHGGRHERWKWIIAMHFCGAYYLLMATAPMVFAGCGNFQT
jgi:hypothetical protein